MNSAYAPDEALLILDDGTVFRGRAYGARGRTINAITFTTAMSGYYETLTNPVAHDQIVVMTAPHIGNTGITNRFADAERIRATGVVARDPARRSSNWSATGDLRTELDHQQVVGISHVDTRALTRRLRRGNVGVAGIFSGADLPTLPGEHGLEELRSAVRDHAHDHAQGHAVAAPTAMAHDDRSGTQWPPSGDFESATPQAVIAAIDLGLSQLTIRRLTDRGALVQVFAATATAEDIRAAGCGGVFYSEGPGNPADSQLAADLIATMRQLLDLNLPIYGIGLGHQLLGRALGFETIRLAAGHHGQGYPVRDVGSGTVAITSHHHAFAVDMPSDQAVTAPYDNGRYGHVLASHICLNDQSIEGIRAIDRPVFSTQFHPEPAAGPRDAAHLFDQFLSSMKGA